MLNKSLLDLFPESKKSIAQTVIFQWFGLLLNIANTLALCSLIFSFHKEGTQLNTQLSPTLLCLFIIGIGLPLKYFVTIQTGQKAFDASSKIKGELREKIFQKMVKLGGTRPKDSNLAEILQLLVEGVEQLELYFSGYVPQLFYSLLAPLTLFAFVSTIDIQVAVVLFLCVPLIPICIVLVQKLAKKLFYKYWGEYTSLGDLFLENLQGLTTLKIYQADGRKAEEMHESAEKFRKITMSVLKSQLNSIIAMDFVAYGGSALGMILASSHLASGRITPWECLVVILLSAEFFLPMRRLGAFFHISMNGMAASKKIFHLLAATEMEDGTQEFTHPTGQISFENVTFSYEEQGAGINSITLTVNPGELISIVGESGSGKSTLAKLLRKEHLYHSGSITIGGQDIKEIKRKELIEKIAYIPYSSYVFSGTISDNLKLAKSSATDSELLDVLKQVNLLEFIQENKGLDTPISAEGSNLSGGQKQRIALAMAILRKSEIYIFDEATSQVDAESEQIMLEQIYRLSKNSTVIMISHSLRNCIDSSRIYVLKDGKCVESGSHHDLLKQNEVYSSLWATQEGLVNDET
ncbi:MAG: ABC transporter ATP-binding protein/permease [Eubacteriales bacterium]